MLHASRGTCAVIQRRRSCTCVPCGKLSALSPGKNLCEILVQVVHAEGRIHMMSHCCTMTHQLHDSARLGKDPCLYPELSPLWFQHCDHLHCALMEICAARKHRLHQLRRESLRMRPSIPAATQPCLGPPPEHCAVWVVKHLVTPPTQAPRLRGFGIRAVMRSALLTVQRDEKCPLADSAHGMLCVWWLWLINIRLQTACLTSNASHRQQQLCR